MEWCADWAEELEGEDRAGTQGVPRPAPLLDAADWAREALGFDADAMQARVLRSGSRRVILNCTRQWGKSTVTAAKAIHEAWTKPGSLTIAVSPSARQSAAFVRKAEEFVVRLGVRVKGDGDNAISLALPNGSRIVGLPGNADTVRGFSAVGLLLVDEAARVEDSMYAAVRPMLAVSGGALWLMSTPHGKVGFFWETWECGGAEWERVRAPAEGCARIKAHFLAEERQTLGERHYRQEYGCEFGDSESGVFDRDIVERAISGEFGVLGIE